MTHIPSVNISIVNALCGLTVIEIDKCAASFGNKEETFIIRAAGSEERKYVDCEDGALLGIFHCGIRNFYDKHGYPVARLIKTKSAADVVYFIMKPLEMLFLLVLYLVDAKPENRIAVQYMPKEGGRS